MVTMHCTFPDGGTSEARYGLALADVIELYDMFQYGRTDRTPMHTLKVTGELLRMRDAA